VNVGAGAGSYEPATTVLAIEPSRVMAAQRPATAAPVWVGGAEALPLADGSVDAALAVLTIHHWADLATGIAEMRRVARRTVILTWDWDVTARFWLYRYLPEAAERDRALAVPIDTLRSLVGPLDVRVVPVPHDCQDGFLGAFWRRPGAYLDPVVRANISSLARLTERSDGGLARLAADIESGRWATEHADLLDLDRLDVGYRLVVADRS
jgi:SAM-dependent methyltransferase